MILDGLLQFSSAQNLAVVAGTTASDNVIDWHISGLPTLSNLQGARDMGIGDDPALKLLVQVGTAFTGGTSLQVAIQGATDNGSGVANSFNTWYTTPAIALASLVAGARLMDMDFPRPPQGIAIPRFVRLAYITLGTMTAGTINAYVVLDRMDQPYSSTNNAVMGGYPAGITVAN